MSTIWSQAFDRNSVSWLTTATVFPRDASSRKMSARRSMFRKSRPLVGSSRRSACAPDSDAMAQTHRCF